jgi:hypothetical protein
MFFLRAVYAGWLVWAWIASIPAFLSGAALVSTPTALLVAFSVIVIGLLCDHPLAWLLSPLPAALVAFLGVPWFVLNAGTSLGYDWYHDSPGLLVTLLAGAALPAPALMILLVLVVEWRHVLRLFLRRGGAI